MVLAYKLETVMIDVLIVSLFVLTIAIAVFSHLRKGEFEVTAGLLMGRGQWLDLESVHLNVWVTRYLMKHKQDALSILRFSKDEFLQTQQHLKPHLEEVQVSLDLLVRKHRIEMREANSTLEWRLLPYNYARRKQQRSAQPKIEWGRGVAQPVPA